MTEQPGLRERKKQATREALRSAALRLALERGPQNVLVEDIAEAAGVSPRTYNNYFSSREQAIVAAVTAEREIRIAGAIVGRPTRVRLSNAVIDAVVDEYTDPGVHARDVLSMLTTNPALLAAYLDGAGAIEAPIADALHERCGDLDQVTAQVLAAAVAGAIRVALGSWLRRPASSPSSTGLVVPSGSLPELLRAALRPLAPALDAASTRPRH